MTCTIPDFNLMSMQQRLQFIRGVSDGPAQQFQSGFKDWRAIEGIIEFFDDRGLGKQNTWISYTDGGILQGVERGVAMAAGMDSAGDMGNPGADLWRTFLVDLQAGRLGVKTDHDHEWGLAEQASTNYGVSFAQSPPINVKPTNLENNWFSFSQVFRWVMINELSIRNIKVIGGLLGPLLDAFTNVTDATVSYGWTTLAWNTNVGVTILADIYNQNWTQTAQDLFNFLQRLCNPCTGGGQNPAPLFSVYDVPGGGAFRTLWNQLGGMSGLLGDPTSNWGSVSGGQSQNFAGATAYWSSSTGTHEIHGAIRDRYNALGGPAGSLGYPTSNEQGIGSGRVNYLAGTSCGSSSGSAIYWNGAAHAVTGCIFQYYKSVGEATGSLGFPAGDAFSITGGVEQVFEHGFITDINGTVSQHRWQVGHAAHAGNDYPYETIGQFGHQNEGTDAWNEYYGQCDSFAAWKVYENLAGSAVQHPSIVPAPGWTPGNASISPVNQFTWGNADIWASKWKALGYAVDTVPSPGAIAYWPNATTDPQDGNPPDPVNGLGEFGHVAYVTDVYPDGSITVEGYNMRENGQYSVVHMNFSTGYTDNSFGQPNFSVPWPKYFIHVSDGPSGAASPTEPSPGVVQARYPSQVTVIGPGSPSSQFSTANVWYSDAGHGEIGTELWTHTNGPATASTATWTPAGLAASACYQVDAFVPDNYSDNPTAIYTISDATGTSYAAVNENVQTNDWSELGVFKTNGSGTGLSVKLDDRGVTGLYVAADAMRFWKQASCAGEGDVSPIFMPSSYVGTWSIKSGHGFFGSEHYITTTGTSTSDHSASWTPSHLMAYGCYDVSLYVPDNFSDNPGALYFTNDSSYGVFYPQIDENGYTNQFAWIGTFQAYGDGTLPAELFNEGPSGDYVAADAIAYVLNPHCLAENGGANAFGSTYTSSIIGPGSGPPGFTTTNDWYLQAGHGYANHELWTHTNGSTPVSTATWTFYGTANACYTASAYIPNNYANNASAAYTISTQTGSIGTSINQANSTGWTQFPGNPKITTGGNGQVTVTLNDTGPTGTYTAADAISFIQTGC